MKTLILFAVLACCFAVYGQGGWNIRMSGQKPSDYCYWDGNGQDCCQISAELCASMIPKPAPSPEPFDVAPQQWATYEWHDDNCIKMIAGTGSCWTISGLDEEKHWGCADPRRTLLTSEDQVKHCYFFSVLENR